MFSIIDCFMCEKSASEDKIIVSLVYAFAKGLPYSIDWALPEFVPGIFLNLRPASLLETYLFKDHDNLYKKMINWSDTLKSGVLLQICYIFQLMLMGEIPSDYEISEKDYYDWGISGFTKDEEYNRNLFMVIKDLFGYCEKINSINNIEERKKMLDEVYLILLDKVGNKVGGFRQVTISGNVYEEIVKKPSITWRPVKDLEMLFFFERINLLNVDSLVNEINKLIGSKNKKLKKTDG